MRSIIKYILCCINADLCNIQLSITSDYNEELVHIKSVELEIDCSTSRSGRNRFRRRTAILDGSALAGVRTCAARRHQSPPSPSYS